MRFDIITIFPNIFSSYFQETVLKRAQEKGIIQIRIHDLREFSRDGDPHRSVDDRPYGGGPGMILMIEPIFRALRFLRAFPKTLRNKNTRVILLTPQGKRFTQRDAERLSSYKRLILLCGRYEGFDARVEKLVDEKISLGDFILAGGEIPAMAIVEAVSRNIPGVIGNSDALREETFSRNLQYREYPQYTRPEVFYPDPKNKKLAWHTPKVLLSGNHAEIQKWRRKMAQLRSKKSGKS